MAKQLRTNLAYLRFVNGRLSQKAVSEATGIGQKTLSALETGASKGIEFNTLLRLCMFFQCTPSDLLVIEEEPEDVVVSEESRRKAKGLVALGLRAAMQAGAADPEQIWAEFDAVRARMQDAAERGQAG
ncbi:MAG TPA: helix-turn-helix transcriptional regulator [Candidatus Obscuribacterales bacterium]